jgi:uncharacterized protein involved in type VI secretion and phage assembly
MTGVGHLAQAGWWMGGAHLAVVTSIQDPESKGRVQIQVYASDPDGTALVWARVAVGFAGTNYGAFFLPDVGEEVLVVFAANDARYPVVIGALWNGAHDLPEQCPGDRIDRWTLTGRNGTRIAIIEESNGTETVEITTPGEATARLTDESGGEIHLQVGTHSITMGNAGIAIETSSEFSVQAATVSITANTVTTTTQSATFSATATIPSLFATSVTSAAYNSAPGNIW